MGIAHGHPTGHIQKTAQQWRENRRRKFMNNVRRTPQRHSKWSVRVIVVSGLIILCESLSYLPASVANLPMKTNTLLAAVAQEKSAPQAKENFEQEWTKLMAAAKREGMVAVASGGAPSRQYRPVVEVFQKKFGVTVEVSTGNATDTVNRVLA